MFSEAKIQDLIVERRESRQIANTILEQMGGIHMGVMTDAHNIVILDSGVRFDHMAGKGGISRTLVNYDRRKDHYDIEFWNMKTKEKVSGATGIYCDMLVDIFEEETGLATSL